MTSTRSATRIASGMLWVTMTIVVPVRSCRRSNSRLKRSRVRASRALNGSSRRSTSGARARDRAIAARWRIPPESWTGLSAAAPVEADEIEQLREPRGPARGRPAGQLERIGDVVRDGPPREEARLLEDEPDPRIRLDDRAAVERDRAALGGEQARGDAQERRLAAAVRADQRDDLAAGHVERQAVEGDRGSAGARSGKRDPRSVATRWPPEAHRWEEPSASRVGRHERRIQRGRR